MIRQTLPESRLEVPRILFQKCSPVVARLVVVRRHISWRWMLVLLLMLLMRCRLRMEGVKESLDRLRGFGEERVVRVSWTHNRPDLYFGYEDAEAL